MHCRLRVAFALFWMGLLCIPKPSIAQIPNAERLNASQKSRQVAFDATALERANARFREEVTAILNRVARTHGLGGVEPNWVMVSPLGVMQSPVALLQGRSKMTREELAKGQDLALVDFSLPEGSEVPSGFYVLHVRQENGRWIAALRDLQGKVVLQREAEVGPSESQSYWPGRSTGIYSLGGQNVYGVRFGAELPAGSFYMVVRLGRGRIVPAQDPDARAITAALEAFRREARAAFAAWLKEQRDVFIASRSDALVVAALDPGSKSLVSYLRTAHQPGGLYRVRAGTVDSVLPGAARSPEGTFRDVSAFRTMAIGIVGGISGATATLGYIGSEIEPFLLSVRVH